MPREIPTMVSNDSKNRGENNLPGVDYLLITNDRKVPSPSLYVISHSHPVYKFQKICEPKYAKQKYYLKKINKTPFFFIYQWKIKLKIK